MDFKGVFRPGSFEAVVQKQGAFNPKDWFIWTQQSLLDTISGLRSPRWCRLGSLPIRTSATSTTCDMLLTVHGSQRADRTYKRLRPRRVRASIMCQALIFRPVETSVPGNFILLLLKISDQSERSWFAHTTLDRFGSRLLLCEHGKNRFSPSIRIKQTSHMSEYTPRQDVGSGIFGQITTRKTRERVEEE